VQTVDQLFQGESGGSRTGREFCCHLHELAIAFRGLLLRFPVADKGSCSLMRFEQASEFELAISSHHRVGVNREIDRELANRGQLIAGSQGSGGNAGAHLIDKLSVDRDARVQIQSEQKGAVPGYP